MIVVYTFACSNETQVSISNPLIYATCDNKQLWDSGPRLYIQLNVVVAAESQVHTSRIIAFVSREKGSRLQKKSYLHDFLWNQYAEKLFS